MDAVSLHLLTFALPVQSPKTSSSSCEFASIAELGARPQPLTLWHLRSHYLGSVEYSFSLNFSRPAHPIIAMYYNMLKFGFDGYRKVSLHNARNARLLARALENSKYYTVVSDLHKLVKTSVVDKAAQAVGLSDDIEAYTPSLPVVAVSRASSTFLSVVHSLKRFERERVLAARC